MHGIRTFAPKNVSSSLFSLVKQFSCSAISKNDSAYNDFVKNELPKYESGDVYLIKDEKKGVAQIVLDNPSTKNAISGSMAVKLNDIVNDLKNWENGRAAIVYGTDKQLCSGLDTKHFSNYLLKPEEGGMICRYLGNVMQGLNRLPLVTVCLIQGSTLCGGAEIAIACDFRLMQEDAVLRFRHVRTGLTTAFGGGTILANRFGKTKAMQILLQSKLMNYKDAMEIDLVDASVPADANVVDWSTNWLWEEGYLKLDAELIQCVNKITTNASLMNEEESLKRETDVFESLWQGRLHKQTLAKQVRRVRVKN